ncbi:cytochrome c oxidase polypeptide VI mitochondrial precursor [Suhomyces tanzawaensis NRRL Y-17324]|uniref:Cytochrome c oxidase subunit 6, mitochondrial n=1 Tax=Suhomyces tanzawaensis NRRL Y-17324 TaxID=984487 RepID=A0A1E4SCG6_9ASCO|nr:cytochrome c oxidase polypeptide VI mitochondrial precursor [Suhomyces tanzawaensis NRRL Y-17324]ODV77092.1 cytochrome c oxidase polypeptide VI mitochondrial precursor [Suhomyces tanzawaensis NRRL Y-17324]
MFTNTIRSALRVRVAPVPRTVMARTNLIRMAAPQQVRMYSDHHEETFEEFTARYEQEFENAYDLFEVQRILNNCFSYDLVPAPVVVEKALQACRRVNDYPTAVRTFEALKHKVENNEQYEAYLEELKDIRQELGIDLKEDLYADKA